jgi:lipoprotein-anchoring transpeptidase ErfK/SrfK
MVHRVLAIAIMVVGGGGLLTGISLDHGIDDQGPWAAPPAAVATPPKVSVTLQPAAGAAPISPIAPVSARADDGTFRAVALTAEDGTPVPGELSPDRTSWTASGPLSYGTRYTWSGIAVDADGKTVPVSGALSTVSPDQTVRATLNLRDGRTVGIAAPIILQFDGHVTDRAAVERALTVRSSIPTEGSWGWLPDEAGGSRVVWRPAEYWQPNTQVRVEAELFGVDYGDGAYGAGNLTLDFAVGRAQVTEADVTSHQLVVLRDGVEVARYDASYGLDSDPNRNTRSGIHVITEKFTNKRMTSQRYGYDVVEKWAVRMSNNGEFIHANPATVGVQGSRNVSHGCVNLSLADAKAYYDMSIYGDPVEVTGSKVPLSAKDGDIWVWTLDWPSWHALSALDDPAGTTTTLPLTDPAMPSASAAAPSAAPSSVAPSAAPPVAPSTPVAPWEAPPAPSAAPWETPPSSAPDGAALGD